jgi:hypothetical protein
MRRLVRSESGQGTLAMVLVLIILGALILIPLLAFMSTGLKAGQLHEEKVRGYYAADAGVEDAIWQIKNDQLRNLFPGYSPYQYGSAYSYPLSQQVNGHLVSVEIENVWVPKGIEAPGAEEAEAVVEQANLVVIGGIVGESEYEIKITYYYTNVGDADGQSLRINQIGVWLPPGSHYDVDGPCNLEGDSDTAPYARPSIVPHCGSEAAVWDFGSGVPLNNFPAAGGGSSYPMTKSVTFHFVPPPEANSPVFAVCWARTSGVADESVSFAWDADVRVYRIVSTATDPASGEEIEVESYITKTVPRELGTTITGDYRAVGATLMIDRYRDAGGPRRDTLLAENQATVDDIPSSARVDGAYLYWSAWLAGEQAFFLDDCHDFYYWISGSCWSIYFQTFRSHYSSGAEQTRYLTLKDSLDLSAAPSGTQVRWKQRESGTLEPDDALQFQFSGDGGASWSSVITAFNDDIGSSWVTFNYTIPDQYLTANFKIRFYLRGFSGSGEYAYLDDICITPTKAVADTSVYLKINGVQVYLDENGEAKQGAKEIAASRCSVLENKPGTYSYACYRDVTKLVQTFSSLGEADNHTGNGVYTVGGVYGDTGDEWSYAAWSLIIIYSSPETKRHQLYLYDNFVYSGMDQNVDFDNDGRPGGAVTHFYAPDPIAGERVAARLTCFVGEGDDCYDGDSILVNGHYLSNSRSPHNDVWNSASPGLVEDGIDIDTFEISWADGAIKPGDTSAQIDLPTETDSWNLIYVILSFRSATTTGGTISYLIRG